MGMIGCPETSVANCNSVLHNMPQEHRISHDDLALQTLVWLHMVRFRAIGFGVVPGGVCVCVCPWWPHILKCQISWKKTSSSIRVNIVLSLVC